MILRKESNTPVIAVIFSGTGVAGTRAPRLPVAERGAPNMSRIETLVL